MPMTSPVERISGPSRMSVPGNLLNGKTGSLTEKYGGHDLLGEAQLLERLARHDLGGELGERARRSPCETKGTVREARGLTSMT